jgi:hypothetical protein
LEDCLALGAERRGGVFLLGFLTKCTTGTDFGEALISLLLKRWIEVNITAPSQSFYMSPIVNRFLSAAFTVSIAISVVV